MSNLFVDKISGKSGTSSGAPITLSGDTATLSSGVTGGAGLSGMPASALSASGISSGKFLKGDNTWDTAGSTSASDLTSGTLSTARLPAGTMVWLDTKKATSAAGSVNNPTSWIETDDAGNNPRLDIDVAQATIDLYSAIHVEINSTAMVSGNTSFTLAEFRIARDGAGIMGARQLLVGYPSNSMGAWFGTIHLMGTDESPPSSGGCKYEMQFRNHHGNSGYAGNIAPMGSETDITATISVWGIV